MDFAAQNEIVNNLFQRLRVIASKEIFEEIGQSAVLDLVELFNFDYGTLSIVDHFKDQIFPHKYSVTRIPELVKPEIWEVDTFYPLNHADVLVECLRTKKVLEVEGNIINGKKVEIKVGGILNKNIYETYNHKDLKRLFIPMISRYEQTPSIDPLNSDIEKKGRYLRDYPIGVFELGVHRSTKRLINKELISLIQFYIDLCSYPYSQAFARRQKQDFDKILEEIDTDNPKHFLQNFLDKIRVIVNASFADLLITPRPILDNGKWHPVDSFVSGKKSEKFKEVLARILQPNQGKIGVFRHVLNTRKYYISRDPKSDPYFIMDSDSVHIKSILSIPLIYSDEVIGIINLNSSKQNFFKESTADSIQAFSNQVARIYIDKRLNFQIKELTIPFNIFSTSEINRIFINILENYFW